MVDETEPFKWEESYTEGINIRALLREDEGGSVEDAVARLMMEDKLQRRREERPSKVRLGMMRQLHICLDLSGAIISNDFEPSKLRATQNILLSFMDKFFELNPLSTMGIIIGREKRAERICGFTSSIQELKEAVLNINEANCNGEFSLYSVLNTALHSFQNIPSHSSKECLLIVASLSTVDAANLKQIYEVCQLIQSQMKWKIVLSFAIENALDSLFCSLIVCRSICFQKACLNNTRLILTGKYGVALDKEHLALLLDEHIQPPPVKKGQGQQDSIVRMGFPQRINVLCPSFCACHELSNETGTTQIEEQGTIMRAFFCPQCGSRYCQTPIHCRVCGLLLLTAPQLARAHQHLEPLPAFLESTPNEGAICFACDIRLPPAIKSYKCKNCEAEFCIDCDILLHESLQVCPSCG